jgi:hypothetical protein
MKSVHPGHPFEFAARSPTPRARLLVALGLGCLSAILLWFMFAVDPTRASDFDPLWTAARALTHGDDPYVAFVRFPWPWPMYYPIMAAVPLIPLTVVPLPVARAIFAGCSTAAFAYAMTRRTWWGLTFLVSGGFLYAWASCQWTTLMVAAVGIPALRPLWVAKPSTGLASAAWLTGRRPILQAVVGALALTAIGFALDPVWVSSWLQAIGRAGHISAPVMRPFGWLLLLAALRWRQPSGRALLAIALLPQNTMPHEALPVSLFARSPREILALATCSWIAAWYVVSHSRPPYSATVATGWPAMLLLVFLPALVLVLRRPSDTDEDPAAGS